MLSRVEALSQLFIIGTLPKDKFYASPKALSELERLHRVCVNNNPTVWEQEHDWTLRIASLNCHSLLDKIGDLRSDKMMLRADVLCLTETWLMSDDATDGTDIPGYGLHLNSKGRGKGIAMYTKMTCDEVYTHIKTDKSQMTRLSTSKVDIINLYRSQGANNSELVEDLKQTIQKDHPTIICGDFNICFLTKRDNEITKILEGLGFEQLVKEASHLLGGQIDHVYSNLHRCSRFKVDVQMYSPYYTSRDHDAFLITISSIDVEGNMKEKVF